MGAQRMGRKSFCMFFRGIELAIEVFGMSSPIRFQKNTNEYENRYRKSKTCLATLQEEKRAQQDRLKKVSEAKARLSSSSSAPVVSVVEPSYEVNLAAQAKQQLDTTLHAVLLSGVEGHCQIASAKERFGLR